MRGHLNDKFSGNFCLPKFRDNLSVPPEDGTDVLFRNVGKKTATIGCVMTQKGAVLKRPLLWRLV